MADALRIEPVEVKHRMDAGERIVFVDARNPTDWGAASQKVKDAIRVGVGEVEQKINVVPEGPLIVTYCT